MVSHSCQLAESDNLIDWTPLDEAVWKGSEPGFACDTNTVGIEAYRQCDWANDAFEETLLPDMQQDELTLSRIQFDR